MQPAFTTVEPEAERNVAGALVLDGKAYFKIVGLLSPGDFFDPFCREIFKSVERLAKRGETIDLLTVAADLEGEVKLAEISDVVQSTVSSANIVAYARVVQSRSRRRQTKLILGNALQRLDATETDDVVTNVMTSLQSVSGSGGDLSFDDVIDAAIDTAEQSAELRRRGSTLGVSSTIPSLDSYTGGLYGGKMITLGGRPGTYKSALAWQILLRAAKKGQPVGLISLEMGPAELGGRAVANVYKIHGQQYLAGYQQVVEQAKPHLAELRKYPIRVDYKSSSIAEVVSRINEWKYRYDIQLACIDYLQLVTVPGEKRLDAVGVISRQIKLLAMNLDIPILVLAQLNRESEKLNRRPVLSDLRESGSIEQDSDIVMFTHCQPGEGQSNDGYELILAKQRGGAARKIIDLEVRGEHFFIGEKNLGYGNMP